MIEDIEFLDDATRPRAPKLEGLTSAQREAGEHLRMIHDHLRDNMRVLRRLIDRAATGEVTAEAVAAETEDMVMLTNFRRFGTLCGQYCQFVHGHHSIEDQAIFPALSAKSEALRKVADRLRAEHVVVHELLVRLVSALNAWRRSRGRRALRQRGSSTRRWSGYCSHTSATKRRRSATRSGISACWVRAADLLYVRAHAGTGANSERQR